MTGDDAQTQVDLQLVGYSDKLFNTQLKLSHSRPPLPCPSSPSLLSPVHQAILDCSVLEIIEPLLCQGKDNVRKEACWLLSNVTAGNRAQIQVSWTGEDGRRPTVLVLMARFTVQPAHVCVCVCIPVCV